MEILIVRHCEPDYSKDSLTEKGVREAKLLAQRMAKTKMDHIYCSPLGRAQKTASYTLELTGKTAETLPWLREFEGRVKKGAFKTQCCWDRKPSYWTKIPDYYTYEKWHLVPLMKKNKVFRYYKEVCDGVDELLLKHGYRHDGKTFKVEKSNHDTIVLFCHFGVEAVILSHIFGISPMILWHNFRALPSSVTRIVTEEREKGCAMFTCLQFGDLSHLYSGDEPDSFMARFCECYDDKTRH